MALPAEYFLIKHSLRVFVLRDWSLAEHRLLLQRQHSLVHRTATCMEDCATGWIHNLTAQVKTRDRTVPRWIEQVPRDETVNVPSLVFPLKRSAPLCLWQPQNRYRYYQRRNATHFREHTLPRSREAGHKWTEKSGH